MIPISFNPCNYPVQVYYTSGGIRVRSNSEFVLRFMLSQWSVFDCLSETEKNLLHDFIYNFSNFVTTSTKKDPESGNDVVEYYEILIPWDI